ncbi:Uncharacterised protein [Vibrio cholerae]|uniref:Uncharacterized protein n=1 Tax=Vibrio cholerae TaxID=666 RepID=A0A656A6Q9_VIBCL|nr:hypothetical protein [Vibrio cholerae]OEC21860.1 hypothetical protein BFX10_18210 [Vibrio cholerae]OFI94888.1 hypothetical protein BFX21_17680 [Vibrio cholerae]CSC38179.1 Uncharacterised protein [Vibrio cholerae]CSC92722.1 Uncharacterised protein [Vibrio cholerae]CSE20805.1 Uncharacterised protein [Vibrio cholerae]
MGNWKNIEKLVLASKDFILTEEERQLIVKEEQQAYVTNMPAIIEVLNMAQLKLKALGFWVENNVTEQGTRFRFSLQGYYGPGGFSTQFHISGPLVLGLINPAGDQLASFYPNDIDQCFLMGLDFDKTKFEQFVLKQIENYLQPENLITSKEQYDRFRALLSN